MFYELLETVLLCGLRYLRIDLFSGASSDLENLEMSGNFDARRKREKSGNV